MEETKNELVEACEYCGRFEVARKRMAFKRPFRSVRSGKSQGVGTGVIGSSESKKKKHTAADSSQKLLSEPFQGVTCISYSQLFRAREGQFSIALMLGPKTVACGKCFEALILVPAAHSSPFASYWAALGSEHVFPRSRRVLLPFNRGHGGLLANGSCSGLMCRIVLTNPSLIFCLLPTTS